MAWEKMAQTKSGTEEKRHGRKWHRKTRCYEKANYYKNMWYKKKLVQKKVGQKKWGKKKCSCSG